MTDRATQLSEARESLLALAGLDLTALDDDALLTHLGEVERAGRVVDALRVAGAAELDHRSRRTLGPEGLAARHGCRRSAFLLERVTLVSQSEASRRIRIGRTVRADVGLDGSPLPLPFPAVGAALLAGGIGVDAAHVIVANLTLAAREATVEAVADAELRLVGVAQQQSADLVGVEAVLWRTALAPDGTAPHAERVREQRRFTIGRENVDGLTPFSGLAEPVFAATLRVAIGERTSPSRQPRFLDPADVCEDADESSFARDGRSSEQRAYDVLEGLLTAGIRSDAVDRGPLHSTATVNVVVRASDLVADAGPAWLDDVREPISAVLASELACSGGARFVGVDDRGQPLWLGRRERLFTAAQRAALAVRDGGCVLPGCGAPPSWCHAHHIVHWGRGGPTDVDNGVLLCSFHHHLVHRGDYRLRMTREGPELQGPTWVDPDQRWIPVGTSRWARAA